MGRTRSSRKPLRRPRPRELRAAKSLQSCPTLCDPIDRSPLGSPVPGILQARIRFRKRTRDCSPGHAGKEGPQLASTPVFLPGESQGRGSLVGFCLWGHTESDTTEALFVVAGLSPTLIGPMECGPSPWIRNQKSWVLVLPQIIPDHAGPS